MTTHRRAVLVALAVSVSACGRKADTAPPVAAPTVTLARSEAPIGSPIEMKYRFIVASDAPAFAEDYWVFVHFLDADRELMWTDDHEPPAPTRRWKPGETIEYERTMFVPKFPYTGETTVEIGLFSRQTNQRLPLAGETRGQRSYVVGRFDLKGQSDNQFVVFKDGWHPTEVADDSIGTEWQWSKKDATLTFRNPRQDATIYLQLDRPVGGFPEPQHVQIRIGDAAVDSFTLAPKQAELRKIPVTASQLGSNDTVEMKVSVDKTFVPATIAELKSGDPRELGVRVFRAYIQTR